MLWNSHLRRDTAGQVSNRLTRTFIKPSSISADNHQIKSRLPRGIAKMNTMWHVWCMSDRIFPFMLLWRYPHCKIACFDSSVPKQYLNQRWLVNRTVRNKIQWNLYHYAHASSPVINWKYHIQNMIYDVIYFRLYSRKNLTNHITS